jgi:hypothetical protein
LSQAKSVRKHRLKKSSNDPQLAAESLRTLLRIALEPSRDSAQRSKLEKLVVKSLKAAARFEPQKPEPVRTVHHFACTGGTLLGKCLAALPNIQLLSEVDPLSPTASSTDAPQFAPADYARLARQGSQGASDDLLVRLFRASLREIYWESCRVGRRLVIRDHTHSHFCMGPSLPIRPTLRQLLPSDLDVLSLLTTRHPIDSFLSLSANNWIQFTPKTFDEYCVRYLAFLNAYKDVPIVRYEDFVASPESTMLHMCEALQLKYNASFAETFNVFKLTGDSGRSGEMIRPRPRRALSEEMRHEASQSANYATLKSKLGYSDNFD